MSNKKVLVAFQKALGASGLSPNMIQEHTKNIADFASKFLINKTPPCMLLNLTYNDIESYRKLRDNNINSVSFKRFVRFLRDTGRMDWDEAEQLLDVFKRQ